MYHGQILIMSFEVKIILFFFLISMNNSKEATDKHHIPSVTTVSAISKVHALVKCTLVASYSL